MGVDAITQCGKRSRIRASCLIERRPLVSSMYIRPEYIVDEDEGPEEDSYLWVGGSHHSRGGPPPRTWTRITKQPPFRPTRSSSAPPPSTTRRRPNRPLDFQGILSYVSRMLATSAVDITYDDDDWIAPAPSKLYRAASVGNSWGVTSIGRGFNWKKQDEDADSPLSDQAPSITPQQQGATGKESNSRKVQPSLPTPPPPTSQASSKGSVANLPSLTTAIPVATSTSFPRFINSPMARSPTSSHPTSPLRMSPCTSPRPQSPANVAALAAPTPLSRSPTSPRLGGTPRPRRRSSQQRVSLIAGRVSIVQVEPPLVPPDGGPQKFVRASSATSFLSMASDTRPPSPQSATATERSISEFVVEKEIGRGAYGLVKRAREMKDDGTLGVSLFVGSTRGRVKCSIAPASLGDQADYQVAHTRRLLEEASEVWDDPNRNIRSFCHIQHPICVTAATALGPFPLII